MKPRHEIPTPKQLGVAESNFLSRLKNFFLKNHQQSHTEGSHSHNHGHNSEPENININTLALVIDGQVYDVLRAQDSLADLLLARPTFVLVTEETSTAQVNYKYIDGKFVENEPTT